MSTTYALEVRSSDLALLTFLNDGISPRVTRTTTYLVFTVAPGGEAITTKVVTYRELITEYDIAGCSPLVLRMKPEK